MAIRGRTSLKYRLKALEIGKESLPENHPDLASAYKSASIAFFNVGDFEHSLECETAALAVYSEMLPKNRPKLNDIVDYAVDLCKKSGNREKSLECLIIFEKAIIPNEENEKSLERIRTAIDEIESS